MIDQRRADIEYPLTALRFRGILVAVIHAELVAGCAALELQGLDPEEGHFVDSVILINLKLQRRLVVRHEADVLAVFGQFTEIAEIARMNSDQNRKVRESFLDVGACDAGIYRDLLAGVPVIVPPGLGRSRQKDSQCP